MMKTPCEELVDLLADYVDGELPQDEAQRVAQHLAACEVCRETAQALERSLGLAKVIWCDNLGDSRLSAEPMPIRKPCRIRFYAVAAGILIAISALVLTMIGRRSQQPSVPFEVLERQIARAGAAAELLAATQILASCEGTETIVERQCQLILQEYAGTPAAESIRAQYGSRLGGIQ